MEDIVDSLHACLSNLAKADKGTLIFKQKRP